MIYTVFLSWYHNFKIGIVDFLAKIERNISTQSLQNIVIPSMIYFASLRGIPPAANTNDISTTPIASGATVGIYSFVWKIRLSDELQYANIFENSIPLQLGSNEEILKIMYV